jgi:hypothetical protein
LKRSVLLVALVLLAGCGSSDDERSAAPARDSGFPAVVEKLTPQLAAAVEGQAPQRVLEWNDEGRLGGRPS